MVTATIFREGHDAVSANVVLRGPKGAAKAPVDADAPLRARARPLAGGGPADQRGRLDLPGRGVGRPAGDVAPRGGDQAARRPRRRARERGGRPAVRAGRRRAAEARRTSRRPSLLLERRGGAPRPGRSRRRRGWRRPRPPRSATSSNATRCASWCPPRRASPCASTASEPSTAPGTSSSRAPRARSSTPPARRSRGPGPSGRPWSGSRPSPRWASTCSTCRRCTRSGRPTARARTTPSPPVPTTRASRGRSAPRPAGTTRSTPTSARWPTSTPSWPRPREHGLEVALDYALQASPDHPWVSDAPGLVQRARRRHHRLRREPAEEVPGHLPAELRPRLRRPLRRDACGCYGSGWATASASSASTTRTPSPSTSGSSCSPRCAPPTRTCSSSPRRSRAPR